MILQQRAPTRARHPLGHPPLFFLVEDSHIIRELVRSRMEGWGYRVSAVATGREGLSYLAAVTPDVLVLDLKLPDISGRDVLAHVKASRVELPVIILSSAAELEEVLQCIHEGAFDYVLKDPRLGKLRSALSRAAERVALQAENADLVYRLKQANASLEERIRERTKELARANQELAESLAALREKDRLIQQDLGQARSFQQSILPELPLSESVEFGAVYHPVDVVGGDIYDVTEVAPGHFRVFVADATGHGVQASLRTIALKSEYDRLNHAHETPETLLAEFNCRLVEVAPELGLLCTGCCFDLRTGPNGTTLRCVSAAHPPPLHVSRAGIAEASSCGTFLGLKRDVEFPAEERCLEPGDLVVAYTDGLTDQVNPGGTDYQIVRTAEQLKRYDGPLPNALQNVLAEFHGFRKDVPLRDDVTLVVARVRCA